GRADRRDRAPAPHCLAQRAARDRVARRAARRAAPVAPRFFPRAESASIGPFPAPKRASGTPPPRAFRADFLEDRVRQDLDRLMRERGLAGLVIFAHDRYSPAMYYVTGQKIHYGIYFKSADGRSL